MRLGVRVKICGLTNPDDALAAVEAGADAIGLVFAGTHGRQSPRRVDPAMAANVIRVLPPFVTPVGLFVNAPTETVRSVTADLGLSVVQLHGQESPSQLAELEPLRVIKAIGIGDGRDLEQVRGFVGDQAPQNLAALLLDTLTKQGFGGTGRTFDWSIVSGLPDAIAGGRPPYLILAGGLTPENVGEAIRSVRPYAVDVSSGVEQAPGKKDPAKMKRFVEVARAAFAILDESSDARQRV
jgi:phosphoribosylanthranilate isomerase